VSRAFDLSLQPDSRFLRFRQSYTTNEHLMSVFESAEALRGQVGSMTREVASGLSDVSSGLSSMNWAVENGFAEMSYQLGSMGLAIEEGFRGLGSLFSWGLARICWQMEQNRAVYRDILTTLQTPLATVGLELRKRAETAVKNGWWDEAASDLSDSLENNRYDFLAHLQLGRVLWFQYGQWQPAMGQFELAAKYGDAADAGKEQRYYAALAYIHMSLLWRMDGSEESLSQALSASARAWELALNVDPVIIEHVLLLCLHKRSNQAKAVMHGAFFMQEERATAFPHHPDLKVFPEVAAARDAWMAHYKPILAEARDLETRARSLSESHQVAPGRPAVADESRPRTAALSLAASAEAALGACEIALINRVGEAAKQVAQADKAVEEHKKEEPFWDFLVSETSDAGRVVGWVVGVVALPAWPFLSWACWPEVVHAHACAFVASCFVLPPFLAWGASQAIDAAVHARRMQRWGAQGVELRAGRRNTSDAMDELERVVQRFDQGGDELRSANERLRASAESKDMIGRS